MIVADAPTMTDWQVGKNRRGALHGDGVGRFDFGDRLQDDGD